MTEIKVYDQEYGIIKYSELTEETQKDIMAFLPGIEEKTKHDSSTLVENYIQKGYSSEELQSWIEAQIQIVQYNTNNLGLHYSLYAHISNIHTHEHRYVSSYDHTLVSSSYTKLDNILGSKIQSAIRIAIEEKKKISDMNELIILRKENIILKERIEELENKDIEE